jgi:hypothetical protein
MCNKLYQLKILYKYDACFSLNNQKEKMLTEPGVAVRTCAKYDLGADLVLALKRYKEHLPLLANNISSTSLLQGLFPFLEVKTVKSRFLISDVVSY